MKTEIVCLLIFFLNFFNWMMELIFWYINGNSFNWPSFDLVNALQGVFIFGLFVLRRPPRDFIWNRIKKFRGINEILERQIGSMELGLLQMMNGDPMPRQTRLLFKNNLFFDPFSNLLKHHKRITNQLPKMLESSLKRCTILV